MVATGFESIYGQISRLESGNKLLRFIRDLKKEISGVSDSTYHYQSVIDGPSLRGLPVGFTYHPVLGGAPNGFGFVNTGVSLHLGRTNIADMVVESGIFPYAGLNVSISLDCYDKVKETLLRKLEPTLRFGSVRKTPHNTSLYDLRLDRTDVDKVKEAYETELKLIAQRLNEIDRRREDAVQNTDRATLEAFAI